MNFVLREANGAKPSLADAGAVKELINSDTFRRGLLTPSSPGTRARG